MYVFREANDGDIRTNRCITAATSKPTTSKLDFIAVLRRPSHRIQM